MLIHGEIVMMPVLNALDIQEKKQKTPQQQQRL